MVENGFTAVYVSAAIKTAHIIMHSMHKIVYVFAMKYVSELSV